MAPAPLWLTRRGLMLGGAALLATASCTTVLPDSLSSGATPPPALTPTQMTALVNSVRRANGQSDWTFSPVLARAAATQAAGMAAADELSHTLVGTLGARLQAVGYVAGEAGENIAGGQPTLEEALVGWLNSPPHRATLLNRNFNEFGLAVASGPKKKDQLGTYWAMIAGVTVDTLRARAAATTV